MAGSNATATYTVITDTHGYPWGSTTADFDLGDNTNSDNSASEAIHPTTGTKIKIYGNHDVKEAGHNNGKMESWPDPDNHVLFLGLDSATAFDSYLVPEDQIYAMVEAMNGVAAGWDIVILTHIPQFPAHADMGSSYGGTTTGQRERSDSLVEILKKFNKRETGSYSYTDESKQTHTFNYNFSAKTGHVIGCFCGHVHNRIRCRYKGIYMESFYTNGAEEWTTERQGNAGMYPPETQYISIDFQAKKVNGNDYTGHEDETDIVMITTPPRQGNTTYGDAATGAYTMYPGTNSYAKFYQKRYVGYSYSSNPGVLHDVNGSSVVSGQNSIANSWFYVNNAYFHGLSKNVKYIRFDAAGELRYYSTETNSANDYQEIPNYKNAHIVFDTVPCPSTSPGKTWTFINGLFEGVRSTPSFSYKSGVLPGQNGYSIEFNSNGLATGITHYNQDVTYGAGDNWINVSSILVCWRGFGDMESTDSTSNYAQVGITGTFPSGGIKLNLARSTATGYNWIPNSVNLLMRVVGSNSQPYWFYDGRLTTLTDAQVGI